MLLLLLRVLPQFDVVALQEIHTADPAVLVKLVEQLNADGRQFDFATAGNGTSGDGATGNKGPQGSAFVFDRARIEIDRTTVCFVEDPEQRFRHRPLVAQFRAKGPDPKEAFTFKLINVHIDADRAAAEGELLADVYRAVRDDGSQEDDVIMLGDFGAGLQNGEELAARLDITALIAALPTTVRGTVPIDNVLMSRRATTEFTGRSGVFDLMHQFDLTLPGVIDVSHHLPGWCEFVPYEGDMLGHVAAEQSPTHQR